MKKLLLLLFVTITLSIFACAPIQVTKKSVEYTYDKDGKVVKKYEESITQVPERMPPIHLKNTELYE